MNLSGHHVRLPLLAGSFRRPVGRLASLLLVPLAGCHDSPYELAPVTGTVTVDGQPLTCWQVMFAPRAKAGGPEAGKPAIGWLDGQGRFTLSTYQQDDGAVVGEHQVTLFGPADESELPAGIPPFKRFAVRGKAVEVVAGRENRINLEIAKKDLQPMTIKGLPQGD